MKALVRVVAVAALLVAGLASCDAKPGATHDLSGYVTDSDTGAPVAGVMVSFRSDTLRAYDTTTDGSGLYRLLIDTDVPFGQVKATKDGYDPVESSVYFDTDIRRVDLPMHKQASAPTP